MKPLFDRVIIEQDKPKEVTSGGIIIVKEAQDESPRGTVAYIGPDVKNVKPGDRVVMNTKWKQTFKDGGKDYVILNEPDLIGVLDA